MNIRHSFFLLPLLAFVSTGWCLLDHAPSGPSRSTNTWLLGVWEAREADGKSFRAVVAPVSSDRMMVYFTEKDRSGKTVRSGAYPCWFSKVGQAHLLVLELREAPDAGYLVLGYQFLDPLKLRLRELVLNPEKPLTSAFRTRVQIRRQFVRGDLFQGRQLLWHKTGEVYWQQGGNPADHTFEPTRNLPAESRQDDNE